MFRRGSNSAVLVPAPVADAASFLSNFAKKPFTVNEQIKLIRDFLSVRRCFPPSIRAALLQALGASPRGALLVPV